MVSSAASHAPPRCRRHTAKATTASTTGVNRAVAYFTASAAARMTPAGDEQSCPRPELAVSRPDTQPCGQGEQEQRHRVKGREGAQELRARQGSEQRRGQHRGPLPVQADGRGPQQARDPEHEAHRQDARGSEAAQAVRESAQWRVDDGRPGEVRGKIRDRRLVQPPGPFQMAGPQIEGLVLKCRVGPDEPKRQPGLDGEHREQRPRAIAWLHSAGRPSHARRGHAWPLWFGATTDDRRSGDRCRAARTARHRPVTLAADQLGSSRSALTGVRATVRPPREQVHAMSPPMTGAALHQGTLALAPPQPTHCTR